jgi:hypothetical protein
MTTQSRIYFIVMTACACSLLALGFYFDGYISKIALIAGGLYFGHLLTEALNYDESDKLASSHMEGI